MGVWPSRWTIPPLVQQYQPYMQFTRRSPRDKEAGYYCCLYVWRKCVDLRQQVPPTAQTEAFINRLGDQVQRMQVELGLPPGLPAVLDTTSGFYYLFDRAATIYLVAMEQDRNRIFNRQLTQKLLDAAILFDVMTMFRPLNKDQARMRKINDRARMRKIARWKATDIDRCLREGRIPVPGPPADLDAMGDP